MNSFNFLKKSWKNCFLALVGITWVKVISVIEKGNEKGGCPLKSWSHFGTISYQKVNQKIDAKNDVEKT